MCTALRTAGLSAEILELDRQLPTKLLEGDYDVAFPVTHGPLGEDGCLQGLLEVLDVPYVGADVRASAAAAHKPTAKKLFAAAGLPLAQGATAHRRDGAAASAARLLEQLGSKLVLKPASGGSAIGVQRLLGDSTVVEVEQALSAAFEVSDEVLVEQLMVGQEVTCGVLDLDEGPLALPPTLVRSVGSDWYDFRARYATGGSQHECPAQLPPEIYEMVQRCAVGAHRAVGARDLSRVDFVVMESSVVVLEVNTLPGMTATSNYPEAAGVYGIPFPDLCARFVRQALSRGNRTVPKVEPIPD